MGNWKIENCSNHRPEFLCCKEARSSISQTISSKVSERYIQSYTTCVLLRFGFVLFVNKGQDLHKKGSSFLLKF